MNQKLDSRRWSIWSGGQNSAGTPAQAYCRSAESFGLFGALSLPQSVVFWVRPVDAAPDKRVDWARVQGEAECADGGQDMHNLGFSAQRPLHRAWEQDAVLVQSW